MIGRALDSEVAILEWLGLSAYIVNKVAKGKKHAENVLEAMPETPNPNVKFKIDSVRFNKNGDTVFYREIPIKNKTDKKP